MKHFAFVILIAIFFTSHANAACTGTYPRTMNACAQVTGAAIHIPGGTDPYTISTPNREYLLDGDLTVAGNAILIAASNIVLNLQGYTITYNTTASGKGIQVSSGGLTNIGITNGTITQAMSTTTLSSSIDNLVTDIPVADGTVFNTGETLYVFRRNTDQTAIYEQMLINSIDGNTLSVTRGYNSTVATAQDSGIPVFSSRGMGSLYGDGKNPFSSQYNPVTYIQLTDLDITYNGLDVTGLAIYSTNNAIVEYNTIHDLYSIGPITDRASGVYAIRALGLDNIIRYNTIINARSIGINSGTRAQVYNNNIDIHSLATNCIAVNGGSYLDAHDNIITGTGQAPIGFALGSTTPASSEGSVWVDDPAEIDASYVPWDEAHTSGYSHDQEIYNNTITLEVTELGAEYGSATYPGPSTPTATNETAIGIRQTTGTFNLLVHDNTITVTGHGTYNGIYSSTGQPVMMTDAKAKGLMLGLRWTQQSAYFYDNIITANDTVDGGITSGIAIVSNIDNRYWYMDRNGALLDDFRPTLQVYGNTVTSNSQNLTLCSSYGPADGFPLIIQNTFIKSGSYTNYHTYGVETGCYDNATGYLIANSYQGGAAEDNLSFAFSSLTDGNANRTKSITFGHLQEDGYIYYDYNLNNAGGTTGSATPINTPLNSLGPYWAAGDIIAPTVAPSRISGRATESPFPAITLTCADCVSMLWCSQAVQGTPCTPATTYTGGFKTPGQNRSWFGYCYNGTDASDNVSDTICYDGKRQKRR